MAGDCYSALSARIVELVGFPAAYMGGHSTSMMHFAIPDYGVFTSTEMIDIAGRVAEAIDIPVIADADEAGETVDSVYRTVRRYERAGVAGIHIEDEAHPKHSPLDGPLISVPDMQARLAAAAAGRRSDQFVLFARCNQFQVADGGGTGALDEAVRRAVAYAEAGADAFLAPFITAEQVAALAAEVSIPVGGYGPPVEGMRFCLFTGYGVATAAKAHLEDVSVRVRARRPSRRLRRGAAQGGTAARTGLRRPDPAVGGRDRAADPEPSLTGPAEEPPGSGRVDADAVIAYATATNDPNPLYLEGRAVPPLFTVSLLLTAHLEAGFGARPHVEGATKIVHGEHDTRILGPLLPDTRVQWRSALHNAYNTTGGVIETTRTVVYAPDGAPLVEHMWSNFSVNGRVTEDMGPPNPDHTFPDAARARMMGSRTVSVDRDQGFRYAGVSGDRVGHAIDDEIARSEGYPGKILQGLCTFGLCGGALTHLAAAGDPRRIRRLACRFAKPTFPGRDIEIRLYQIGRVEGGRRAFAFEAHQDERTVVKHGRVEVEE